MHRAALAACVSLVLATSSLAQVIDVPGDYADLQDALDAAPSGATVVVHGGHWFYGIDVRKPVTIVGEPRPFIWGDGLTTVQDSPIRLNGPGAGEVVLQNVEAGMLAYAGAFQISSPAISGGGFDALYVYDSKIDGPEWDFVYNWIFDGADAIDVDVPLVWVERSSVTGAQTKADPLNTHSELSNVTPLGAPGGTGIRTTGDVVLIDSTVRGGDGDRIRYAGEPTFRACPGGDGGGGVVCANLYLSNSTVQGGDPSQWNHQYGVRIWCRDERGLPVVASSTSELPSNLQLDQALRLGQVSQLSWPAAASILFVSMATPQAHVTTGSLIAVTPGATFSLDAGPTGRSIQVPNDPTYLGLAFTFQRLFSNGRWSRPLSGIVAP